MIIRRVRGLSPVRTRFPRLSKVSWSVALRNPDRDIEGDLLGSNRYPIAMPEGGRGPYNETSMYRIGALIAGCGALVCIGSLFGQAEFRVYTEHPRIFLEPARLERLRNEVRREALRWQALRALFDAGTAFPEQPLVDALRFQVDGNREAGRRALEWTEQLTRDGIRTAGGLRHAAIVYDWCHGLFDANAAADVRSAVVQAIEGVLPTANAGPDLVRAAILASIAVAGDWPGSDRALGVLIGSHWNGDLMPELVAGGLTDDAASLTAVLEATLAVRHNLEIDLLRPATAALASLVRTRLLSYYPLDIRTAEGLMWRPSFFGPDGVQAGRQAPLYRIADMLLVAYESNLREFQFIQGWIRDDNYMLKSPQGIPYEFLWVNPYLPGLTPRSAPTLAHDGVRGRLFGRLHWGRPTTWIGYSHGRLEMLSEDGASETDRLDGLDPVYFPAAVVVPVRAPAKLVLTWRPVGEPVPSLVNIYLVGLRSGETYVLKVAGRPGRLAQAGAGGILVLRADASAPKRDRIDLRRKVRIELRPALKPTAPRRGRPSLGQ